MKIDQFVQRADMLIAHCDQVLKTRSHFDDAYWQQNHVDSAAKEALRVAVLSFASQVFGPEHTYTKELSRVSKESYRQSIREVQAILHSAREELAGGWFANLRQLVSAEIFTDFLEMSEYLINEGYIHPAAVMIGSVLEEHLRQLCTAAGIAVEQVAADGSVKPKKADALNTELAKAGKYSKLDQKNVLAWLDLRNKAAHGKYSEYTAEQVKNLLSGVAEFVARVTTS
jgi:hypothetical protein